MKLDNILKFLLFTLSIILVYSNLIIYKSYVTQKSIIIDFNNGKTDAKIEDLLNINYNYPNLSATALPLKALLSRYYFVQEKYKKAFKLLDSSRNESPFSKFNEALYSDFFFAIKETDSAIFYSKIAWEGLPNNSIHFTLYMKALAAERQIDKILESFEKVKNNDQMEFWRVFLATMYQFKDEVDMTDYLTQSEERFSGEEEIMYLINIIRFGKEGFNSLNQKILKANENFNNGYFEKALLSYLEVDKQLKKNPDITSNIVLCYYSMKDFENARIYVDKAIEANINSAKMFFFKGLIFFELGLNQKNTCDYIIRSAELGYDNKQVQIALKKIKC